MGSAVDDKCIDTLTFHIVGIAHDGTFHNTCVHVDGILHFGSADAVSADIEYVINAARDPVETIFIPVCSITSEIEVLVCGKIIGSAAFMIAISGSEGCGPG